MNDLEKGSLPDGWRWVRLGEVCDIVSGSTPSTSIPDYWDGDIPWVTPTDLGELDGPTLTTSQRRITKAGLASCSAQMVPAGTVLMSSRAPIGHLAVANVACCTNQGCKNFIPTESLDTWYLFFALKMSVPELKALGSGATFTEISKTAVESFEIPLPPLPEQRRIAAILNEQMAAVERARAGAEAQLDAAKALPAAYLRAVFSSPEAQQWPRRRLGDISEITGGIQKTPDRSPVKFHKPYLTVRNVQRGYLDLSVVERFEVTEDELARLRLRPRDILIVEGNGSLEHIGRNALFTGNGEEWIHQNHIIRVRLSREICSPEFASRFLNSDVGKSQMVEKAKTTSGLYTLSTGKVASLEVPVPSLVEQERIVPILNDQMAAAEQTRKALQEQLDTINKLPAALLRRAFSGEL